MIRYREIQPSAALRTFVNTFWILEHDGKDIAPQRVVPDGHPELIVNWKQPFEALENGRWSGQPRCFLAGQIDGPLLLRPKGPAKILGIGFHPHGAACLFPQPMRELNGRFSRVEDLSLGLARDLERVLDSPDPIAAVETALVAAKSSSGDILAAEAVRRIVLARGVSDLAALARDLGISIRQLERRFHDAVGLPPKLFCRIERFTNVFRALGERPHKWVETAIDCGYYDQAHLIRDCKSIAGTTPSALLSENADLARHFYDRFRLSHSSNTSRRGVV
ncbi:MAG TPA: helix-turn-helix domain-containing protein [Bryobacteraceae bacterium]|nr:helix-turn-helix domain-containing protein [Bryobacteraceae bacterium]